MAARFHDQTLRRALLKRWRKLKRDVLWPAVLFAFAIAFILLSPVWVPIAFLSYDRYQKRLYAAAEQFRCTVCGVVLGRAAIERADDEWEKYVDELHRQNPEYHFRLVRTVHAICIECEKEYIFCEKTNSFIETQMPNHRCT